MEGESFGRYRLVGLVGRGAMGEVWRAYDTVTDRDVAVKVLPARLGDDEDFAERFRREAHAASRLNTPHVIPIHNFGEINGRLYVDMRLVEGTDLQALIASGPLPPAEAIDIITQIASALDAAHRIGLIHRDVKPSNILIDHDGFAYLIDFGIARIASTSALTTTGMTLGTVAYMAPERFTGGQIDSRSDIYALTCVLYQALTAQLPYPNGSLEQQIAAHMFTDPPQPSTTHPHLPPTLDTVIATGLAKDPNHRYPTAKHLAHAAQTTLTPYQPNPHTAPTQAAPLATAQPSTVRNRRWLAPTLVSIAVLATVAATAFAVTSLKHSNSQPVSADSGSTTTAVSASTPSPQVTLPFGQLDHPTGVAVGGTGDLYVTNTRSNGILALPVGAPTPVRLPFGGLDDPRGVAVDAQGTVYVADRAHNRVLMLQRDAPAPTVLPFQGLDSPCGVATDQAGAVYVVSLFSDQAEMLPAGSSTPVTLPITGLHLACGVAVSPSGDVYVVDASHKRVVLLRAGASTTEDLPLTGLRTPLGVAVDSAGNVFVADTGNSRILELVGGAAPQRELPYTGYAPNGVAVDIHGDIYVADSGNGRIVKLARP